MFLDMEIVARKAADKIADTFAHISLREAEEIVEIVLQAEEDEMRSAGIIGDDSPTMPLHAANN